MNDRMYHIEAGSYRIHVGNAVFSTLNSFLSDGFENKSKFILCDENTVNHCVPQLVAGVNALKSAEIIEVDPGETVKNIDTATAIWSALAENGADRNSVLINVGGGMITDLGGFCASAYMRGIPFINVPTSLIGMADAGFGGKNGVDLDDLKNLIGFFKDPAAVFCFPGFLSTLHEDHMLAGLAEILKHGLISDRSHWQKVPGMIRDGIPAELIAESVRLKIGIVNSDPFESGHRKVLNFGHTAGHAIESWYLKQGTEILHGMAVAAGIIVESWLSVKMGLLTEKELEEIVSYITGLFGKSLPSDFGEGDVVQLMAHDKKNKDGNINFTLLNGIGNAVYDRNFETKEILEALNYLKKLKAK